MMDKERSLFILFLNRCHHPRTFGDDTCLLVGPQYLKPKNRNTFTTYTPLSPLKPLLPIPPYVVEREETGAG
jgi:hypothetical protein